MMWKRLFIASAVAVAAFATASSNPRQAHAEMAYTSADGGGCYILGSPSNDFFCSEYEYSDGYYSIGGTDGSGDPSTDTRICGTFDRLLCGGTTTKVVEQYQCNQWKVTDVNGNVTVLGNKPTGLGAGYTVECSNYTKTTTTTVTNNRWDS
jgi:hypothetical protein